jgi:hypothetical protein
MMCDKHPAAPGIELPRPGTQLRRLILHQMAPVSEMRYKNIQSYPGRKINDLFLPVVQHCQLNYAPVDKVELSFYLSHSP